MSNQDPTQVRSSQPVNLRTARKQGLPHHAQLSPAEQQRVNTLKQRHQAGLGGIEPKIQKRFTSAMLVAGATLLGSGGVLAMAVVGGSGTLALLAAAGIGLSGLLFVRADKRVAQAEASSFAFSRDQLQNIDSLIVKVNAESDDEVQAHLQQIRQQLNRIMLMFESTELALHLSMEHSFYLQEFVERYLPDSLRAYLKVPVLARHNQTILEDKTALMLLKSQLTLLQQALSVQEQSMQQNAAEQLVQQQRFLEAKKDPSSL